LSYISYSYYFCSDRLPPLLHSFPTRRSSDLSPTQINAQVPIGVPAGQAQVVVTSQNGPSASFSVTVAATAPAIFFSPVAAVQKRDRKSTRLNSSHLGISYAVFCLKKKIINYN